MYGRRWRVALRFLLVTPLVLCMACAAPPAKEMNQAQGAIDAARAAGAADFAPTDIAAAVDTLARSEQAASVRDYRLALALAIDSRERAQSAAKAAVVARAVARGAAERSLAEVSTLLRQAGTRLEASLSRPPRTVETDLRNTVAVAEQQLQSATAALQQENYPGTQRALADIAPQLAAALAALDTADPPPPRRRPTPRGSRR